MTMEKIKIFLKSNLLKIVLGLFVVIALVIMLLNVFFPKKVSTKITEKVDDAYDYIKDKQKDYEIQKNKIDIEKKIKIQASEEKKHALESHYDVITKIPDRKKRLEKMIEFNKSIKVNLDEE